MIAGQAFQDTTQNLDCFSQDQNGACAVCRDHYTLSEGTCQPTG